MMEKAAHQNIPPPLPPLLGSEMQADPPYSPSPGVLVRHVLSNDRAAFIKRDLVQTKETYTC